MSKSKCPPNSFIVCTDDPDSIRRFVTELREQTSKLTRVFSEWTEPFLDGYFKKHWKGLADRSPERIFKALFNIWCRATNLPNPQEVIDDMNTLIQLDDLKTSMIKVNRMIRNLTGSLNLTRKHVVKTIDDMFVDIRSSPKKKDEIIIERIWTGLFSPHMYIFAKQTAHVMLARIVLYRVIEDRALAGFPLELSRKKLQELLNLRRDRKIKTPVLEGIDTLFSRLSTEGFIPQVYSKAEYDWWNNSNNQISLMTEDSKLKVLAFRDGLDTLLSNILVKLDSYCLAYVDRDVWKEVYQDYLEENERQKLGGFVTPDELVSLITDLTSYYKDELDLCHKSVLDPACGSGTFLVEVVSRLREHLNRKMKCHHKQGRADWELASDNLKTILCNVVGVDIHPFATFLTTVNIFFQIVDIYAIARNKNPQLKFNLRIYTRDSLLRDGGRTTQKPLDVWINGRLREGKKRLALSHEILQEEFDYVIGNPPWGNVLKKMGPLSDSDYRDYLETNYRPSSSGKYDICVLFMHRGLEWLNDHGTLGMVVNNWFLVRKFGKGIRAFIMKKSFPSNIVDFGDHGQLLFRIYTADGSSKGAMNNPVVVILKKVDEGKKVGIIRVSKNALKKVDRPQRRSTVIEFARDALNGKLRNGVEVFSLPLDYLKRSVEDGWLLAPTSLLRLRDKLANLRGPSISTLFNVEQGVTTGLNSAYIIPVEESSRKKMLKESLTYRLVRGRDISSWRISLSNVYIIYPYVRRDGDWTLAFKHQNTDILDLEQTLDEAEANLSIMARLNHRIAKGLVKNHSTANYLVSHYEELKQRRFEGKNVEDYAGAWYAYHRPRNSEIMTCIPKILTPRLTDSARFAIDEKRVLPLDSVITLTPNEEFNEYLRELSKGMNEKLTKGELLRIFLSVINSPVGDFLICVGRPRTPKGDFSIDEHLLDDFKLPTAVMIKHSLGHARTLLKVVSDYNKGKCDNSKTTELQLKLYKEMFGLTKSEMKLIRDWHNVQFPNL